MAFPSFTTPWNALERPGPHWAAFGTMALANLSKTSTFHAKLLAGDVPAALSQVMRKHEGSDAIRRLALAALKNLKRDGTFSG
jgi:hypothetical protein